MTVCISAICDKSRAIVVAADRMVTASYPPIEFEHDTPKILTLTQSCVALTAGNALAHVELIRQAKGTIKSKSISSISEIAEVIKNLYSLERLKKIEDLILKNRGLNIQIYLQNGKQMLPEGLFAGIDNQIANSNYGLELIVAGIDTDAHIYGIRNPGTSDCYDPLGYHAIGSGNIHALSVFIFNNQTPDTSINETVYLTYEAKKAAEVAPGVGQMTDLAIITQKGVSRVNEEDIKKLDKIYKSKFKPSRDEINKLVSDLPFQKGDEDVK